MGIRITDKSSDVDFNKLQSFLKTTIWQSEIGANTLRRTIDNSLCIFAFDKDEQVGFARAVSDKATFCWIDDVFVDPNYHGLGIGGKMIQAILEHPELRSIASWFLTSSNPEGRKVFSCYGFEPIELARAQKLMTLPRVQNEHYLS